MATLLRTHYDTYDATIAETFAETFAEICAQILRKHCGNIVETDKIN
jgi:hypothetical protein